MRILLINSNQFRQPWPVIPFGLCCVAAATEEAGHTVHVLDLCPCENPAQDISEAVRRYKPQVIGISIRNIDDCSGYQTNFLINTVRENVITNVQQHFDGPIIIGGPAVGINPAEILNYMDLSYAIQGEGEHGLIEFLEYIHGNRDVTNVSGLVYRDNNRRINYNPIHPIIDLNTLPFARTYRYIDLDFYKKLNSPVQIQTRRGCGLNCSYCTYNRIEGKTWRLKDPEQVADEIQDIVKATGIRHIEFTDSTFNIPLRHAKEVLKAILNRGLSLQLRTMGLNPGAIDEELVDLMKQAGFTDVDVGVESGSNAMLRSLGKNFRREAIFQAAEMLHSRGIAVNWFLLPGAPGETAKTVKETLDTMDEAASSWDLICIGIGLRVYNGAPVASLVREKNPQSTSDNFLTPLTYSDNPIRVDEIKLLVKHRSLKRSNYCTFDEDEAIPFLILKAYAFLSRYFLPGQPLWRMLILSRKIGFLSGFRQLRSLLFNRRHRYELRRISGNIMRMPPPFASRIGEKMPVRKNVV